MQAALKKSESKKSIKDECNDSISKAGGKALQQ